MISCFIVTFLIFYCLFEVNAGTPSQKEWLAEVDLTGIPQIPVRPVGSGICPNAVCDGTDNDLCFESCGNAPSSSDIYGCPRKFQWALTFDDGPSNITEGLLDFLDEENVRATFCVMGSEVERYPLILKRAFLAGHQIASHTYSHPHLMGLTNEEIIYEVKATEKAIEKIIGVKPRYIRPPYGEADTRVKALFRAMGYKTLLWNVDPTDYNVYMLQNVKDRLQGSFRMAAQGNDTGLNAHNDPGFISLQHDLYQSSVNQIPSIIQLLRRRGYSFHTAAECNDDTEPHSLPSNNNPYPINTNNMTADAYNNQDSSHILNSNITMGKQLDNLQTTTPNVDLYPVNTEDMLASTEDILASTKDIPANTKDMLANTEDMLANTKDIPANTKDMLANTKDIPANTKDMLANTKDIPANTKDMLANTKDIPANTNDMPVNPYKNQDASPVLNRKNTDDVTYVTKLIMKDVSDGRVLAAGLQYIMSFVFICAVLMSL